MSILLRKVKGKRYIALCAKEHKSKIGDIYLNDAMHDALAEKFLKEFKELYNESLGNT